MNSILTKILKGHGCTFQVNADDYVNDQTLQTVRKERGYTYEDVCDVSPKTLQDYDNKVCIFSLLNLIS